MSYVSSSEATADSGDVGAAGRTTGAGGDRRDPDPNGIPLLYLSTRGWERAKELWVERLLGWFEEWQEAGKPGQVWPRLETIERELKFMVLDAIAERGRRDLAGVLRAWFPHEIRAVRTAINRTLQGLGERALAHPVSKHGRGQSRFR